MTGKVENSKFFFGFNDPDLSLKDKFLMTTQNLLVSAAGGYGLGSLTVTLIKTAKLATDTLTTVTFAKSAVLLPLHAMNITICLIGIYLVLWMLKIQYAKCDLSPPLGVHKWIPLLDFRLLAFSEKEIQEVDNIAQRIAAKN